MSTMWSTLLTGLLLLLDQHAPAIASTRGLRAAPQSVSRALVHEASSHREAGAVASNSTAVATSNSTAVATSNSSAGHFTYYLVQWISSNFCTNTGMGYSCQEMKCTPGYPTCGGGMPFISLTSSGTTCTSVSCSGSGGSESCVISSDLKTGSTCPTDPCPDWKQTFTVTQAGSGSNKHKHGLEGTINCKGGYRKLVKGHMQGSYPVDKDFQAFIAGCASNNVNITGARHCSMHR